MTLTYVVVTNNPKKPNIHSIEDVKTELLKILKQEIQKSYVTMAWQGNDLSLKVDKVGKSEILIGVNEKNGQINISEKKRNISFMHKPFVGEVEKRFEDILISHLDAKKVS